MNSEREVDYTHFLPTEAQGKTEEQLQYEKVIGKKLKGDKDKLEWAHFTPEFVDTQVSHLSIEDLAKQLLGARENYKDGKIGQKEAHIKINSPLPITIFHIGDTHLGSIYTDTEEVLRKFKVIKETPNAFVVFMSNMIDNAIPSQFPSNMLANGIPPDKQVLLMRTIAEDLNKSGKILGAVTSPCHEGWTYKHTGQDINALMFGFKERKFPVVQNGGILTINLNGIEYKGALFHQLGAFESNFNKTHGLKQLNRLTLMMDMDWLAGAHRHVGAVEQTFEGNGEGRKKVAYVRTGTAKGTEELHDEWTVGRYAKTGEPTGEAIHLFANTKRLIPTLDFDDAVYAHESYYLREMIRNEEDTK